MHKNTRDQAWPSHEMRCWCGNTVLGPFSSAYLHCAQCQTLISQARPEQNVAHVVDVVGRARLDLSERYLYWLHTLLKYKLPPAKVLELGSAHGSFVALLRWAGFEATGLAMSSRTVDFARQTFDVPMLQGPIEEQGIAPGTLDVMALMDVLEHLSDPVGTMQQCLRLLKPDGILVIHTPCFPAGKTSEEIATQEERFLEILQAKEHLYLFSQRSIRTFFAQLGAEHVVFEPAIFAHYDMFLVVSRVPLTMYIPDEMARVLHTTPGGRLIQACLDLDEQRRALQERYVTSEADRLSQRADIDRLAQLLAEAERDRASRLGVIEAQGAELARLYPQLQQWRAENQALQRRLEVALQDHAAQQVLLHQQTETIARLQNDKERVWQALRGMTQTRTYKLLRACGRWKSVEQTLALVAPQPIGSRRHEVPGHSRVLTRIAVDLTPMLPGGANGDAEVMVWALLQHLSQAVPDVHFVLLTSETNHADLVALESSNIQCCCMPQDAQRTHALAGLKADMLFCPFTTPFFYDPAIPLVSVVYDDVQYHSYPQVFGLEVRHERQQHFRDACRLAQRLICISDYVRQTVLDHAKVRPEVVTTVHMSLANRLAKLAPEQLLPILERFQLRDGRFLLYPANFWPHKNHGMLLTAFKMYRTRHEASDLHLVCTGTPDAQMEYLQDAVVRMGLGGVVSFPGSVPEAVFPALLQACLALIFPSLYEGFGIPVLEAMAFGKPVLCSNVTSLPEVAGDAALYFDPRKPAEIVSAIERLESDGALVMALTQRGYARLKAFGDPAEMAQRYLQVFRDVVRSFRYPNHTLRGVYADGWIGDRAAISYGASGDHRHLELILTLPRRLPSTQVSVQVHHEAHAPTAPYMIQGGQTVTICQDLPPQAGYIELVIDPVFQPKTHTMGEATRTLGCRCTACRIVSARGTEDLLAGMRLTRT